MELLQDAEQLRRVPMFSKLERSKLKLLAFTSECLTFQDGEVLFRAHEPADCAFVLMSGEVEIWAETASGEFLVGSLGENALLGELAVFNRGSRTATLRAKGPVRVLRIAEDAFIKLVTQNPQVALDVMRQLSDKLTRAHRQFEQLKSELSERPAGKQG